MQTAEMEFELTPSLLDTPSLMTPNIVLNAPPFRPSFNPTHTNASTNYDNSSMSNPSSITTTATTTTNSEPSSSISSADVKLSKIEDELKQSFSEPRLPTPGPFQKMSSTNGFILDKSPTEITNDDGVPIEIPSTADVVSELEALTNTNPLKYLTKTTNDNIERETTTKAGDNIRYDSSPTPSMGFIVSPKKKFLIRSQSRTEPSSPIQNNNLSSQSQKSNTDLDDENSIDDSIGNSFARVQDLLSIDTNVNNNQQLKSTNDNGNDHMNNIQIRTDQNGGNHPINTKQPIVINNKRTFQQANIGNNIPQLTKANAIIIPQQTTLNEVTSTEQLTAVKRQKTTALPTNTTVMNFRSSAAIGTNILTATNGLNANVGSDDQRKKQIRDSNREAARRCRERRRQYIEQLEGNLEQHKLQLKQLNEKLARVERENTQLRAILSETKLLHPTSRLSPNESIVDYTNIVTATGMDLNSESNHQTDGGTIQRTYLNRNNL